MDRDTSFVSLFISLGALRRSACRRCCRRRRSQAPRTDGPQSCQSRPPPACCRPRYGPWLWGASALRHFRAAPEPSKRRRAVGATRKARAHHWTHRWAHHCGSHGSHVRPSPRLGGSLHRWHQQRLPGPSARCLPAVRVFHVHPLAVASVRAQARVCRVHARLRGHLLRHGAAADAERARMGAGRGSVPHGPHRHPPHGHQCVPLLAGRSPLPRRPTHRALHGRPEHLHRAAAAA
mmetsp:Transcript_3674/g.11537  ORF Transcript_3674/g.11537 Transcript_3674/m.11537 type:complete len:235 (+) Transcript_3674:393-1097(+)